MSSVLSPKAAYALHAKIKAALDAVAALPRNIAEAAKIAVKVDGPHFEAKVVFGDDFHFNPSASGGTQGASGSSGGGRPKHKLVPVEQVQEYLDLNPGATLDDLELEFPGEGLSFTLGEMIDAGAVPVDKFANPAILDWLVDNIAVVSNDNYFQSKGRLSTAFKLLDRLGPPGHLDYLSLRCALHSAGLTWATKKF